MKKICLIVGLTIIFFSCSKDDDVNITKENISISNTEAYEYDLGGFGDEDGARISQQAEHHEISELNRNETIIYTYKPKENFLGSDLVKIEIITGSDGSSSGSVSKIVEIKFNITE
tara:strand:+ start:1238 stop:1585 length:348 start_codon:yes stop_codon:yes gene_type:complete